MSDIWFIILLSVGMLVAAWVVNAFVAMLSGEHPRDTGRVWLDMMFGELQVLLSAIPFLRRSIWVITVGVIVVMVAGMLIRRLYD